MLPLALSQSEQYVAGAYAVFLVLVVVYLAILAIRVMNMEKSVDELLDIVEEKADRDNDKSKEQAAA